MTEFAPKTKRGLYGAWQSLTVALGLLAGAGLAAILATTLSKEALNDWGWRVPFLAAFPLGLVALWLRLRLAETPNFDRVKEGPQPPADKAEVAKAIALGIGRLMGWSAAGYTFLVVMPSYLQATLHATFQQALVATVLANLGFAVSIMPAGWLSDRIGRRPVMVTGAALVVVLAFPLMNLLQDKGSSNAAKGAAVFVAGLVVGLMAGPGPAMLAEMFPTRARYTGLGLAYSLSNAVFSGSAGLIITELIKRTGNVDIPAYYVAVTSAISVLALLTLRGDDHRRELKD
jgi:MFS family permease